MFTHDIDYVGITLCLFAGIKSWLKLLLANLL
jgi:hypothetical protein